MVNEIPAMVKKTGSRSGRQFGLMSAILVLCCSLDARYQSLAADPFRIFGVAVYLDRDPPCTTASVSSVTVTVSPFKEQIDLGVLVTELARKAAEARANLVYAIKLVSFVPNQGAIATATISTCLQPNLPLRDNLPPFDAKLAAIVERAPDVRAYLFTDRVPDRQGSVQTSPLLQRSFGGADAVARLRRLIFADDTYRSTSGVKIEKSCPFVPSFGFEFRDGDNSAWWLVSEMCETATLVSREKHWFEADTRDLKPESAAAFRQLLESQK
jgi:hypothetical protein